MDLCIHIFGWNRNSLRYILYLVNWLFIYYIFPLDKFQVKNRSLFFHFILAWHTPFKNKCKKTNWQMKMMSNRQTDTLDLPLWSLHAAASSLHNITSDIYEHSLLTHFYIYVQVSVTITDYLRPTTDCLTPMHPSLLLVCRNFMNV